MPATAPQPRRQPVPRVPRITPSSEPVAFQVLQRLDADLRQAARQLTPREVRYYCARYYSKQEDRKMAANQLRASVSAGEPNRLLLFDLQMNRLQEDNIKAAMLEYAMKSVPGQWLLSHYGIGPVIASGLLAHLDITRTPAVANWWSYAGLNPQVHRLSRIEADAWVKAQPHPITEDTVHAAAAHFHRRAETLLRDATMDWDTHECTRPLTAASLGAALARLPWNADLHTLTWKAGDCFKKFSKRNTHDNLYGRLYQEYKAKIVARNAAGGCADLAEATLARIQFKKPALVKLYKSGHIPPAQEDAHAMRSVVKLFMSHVHHVVYETHYGTPPPQPYILAHDPRHTHYIPPPHWPFVPGATYAQPEGEEDESE